MKFSPFELNVLRHMASLNSSMSFHTGKKVWTNTHPFAVFMCLDVECDIPTDFSVLDFSVFLRAIGLTNPDTYEILVNDTSSDIYVLDAKNRVKMTKANPEFIKIREKPIDFTQHGVTFTLTAQMIDIIKKAKSLVSGEVIQFSNTGIKVFDPTNPSNGEYVYNEVLTDAEFSINIDAENFNVLTDDYTVTMPPDGDNSPIMKLQSKGGKYYYILLGLIDQ